MLHPKRTIQVYPHISALRPDPRVGISDDMDEEVVKVSPQHRRILLLRGIHPQGDLKNAMSCDELVQTHVAITILVVDLENFTTWCP